jgi:cytochrome P450 family 9
LLRDPELLKQIGIKDFDHFMDRKPLLNPKSDPLVGNMMSMMSGGKWKDMRAALSPAFTGSKMRQMFEYVSKCGADMGKTLCKDGRKTYDMKDLFTRFTSDVIATAAYGIEVNSFEEPDNAFFTLGKKATKFDTTKILGFAIAPWFMKMRNIKLFDTKATDYFRKVINDNFEMRETKNIVRNDLIQLLLQLKKGKALMHEEETTDAEGFATVQESEIGRKTIVKSWTEDELLAQSFLFFIAGFETASVLLHFVAYELALNADIQQKLVEEILATNNELKCQNLTYEALQKMKYMDMVISEGLRKWPSAIIVDRMCTKDYTLTVDDHTLSIKKDEVLWVPIYAIHNDHKYFPNPEKFDPERFSDERKHEVNHGMYIPFGIGPRNCIGSRFALMESKAVLYYLLLNFSLEVDTAKTRVPMKIAKGLSGFTAENGIHLKFSPRMTDRC